MKLGDIPTPALLLDVAVLRRNTVRMADRARVAGVRLRPHMKTAKSDRVAALATAGHDGAITVSTLAEARYFAAHGSTDIFLAVGMVPAKLPQAATIQAAGARLVLAIDEVDAARALADAAARLDSHFDVLVEIDSGAHRAGLAPDDPAVVEVAGILDAAPALSCGGVFTHAGHSYACHEVAAVRTIAEAERQAVLHAAGRLADAGLPCPVVSTGSTPTAVHAESFEGLGEIRPGVYMFGDLEQAGLGSCGPDDIALSVLATVIGRQPAFNRVNIDAGSLALSLDASAGDFLPDTGYGWVLEAETGVRRAGMYVEAVNQEHGMVAGTGPLPFGDLAVGARVRVLPSHACITAAAHDRYHVVDGDSADPGAVVEVWPRMNGW